MHESHLRIGIVLLERESQGLGFLTPKLTQDIFNVTSEKFDWALRRLNGMTSLGLLTKFKATELASRPDTCLSAYRLTCRGRSLVLLDLAKRGLVELSRKEKAVLVRTAKAGWMEHLRARKLDTEDSTKSGFKHGSG